MIEESDLIEVREAYSELLAGDGTTLAELHRPTRVRDATGTKNAVFAKIAEDIPVIVDEISMAQAEAYGVHDDRVVKSQVYLVVAPYGTGSQTGDLFVLPSGKQLIVRHIADARTITLNEEAICMAFTKLSQRV